MSLRHALIIAVVASCSSPHGPGGGGASGSNPPSATGCDGLRPKIEQLYRAEAEVREPKRVDGYVADNTAMVLGDCAKQGERAVRCIEGASTVSEIERKCMVQLDEEGSEGLELRK